MKFETLKTGKFATKKQIIVGATAVCVVLVAAFSFYYSYAKYRAVQSVKLANGTVDFTPSDLNMVAVHWEKDGVDGNNNPVNYDSKTAVPTSGYLLNTTLSTCEVGGTKDSDIGIEYAGGKVTISNLTKKGTKCYLYFDRIRDTEVPTISNVATTVTKTEINVTVTASDNNGVTEYWYQLDSGTAVKETTNTHTFTGLTAGQTYSLKVWVKDAAGNTSDVNTSSVTTTPNGQTPDTIIAAIEASSDFKSGTPTFNTIATGTSDSNNGIFKVADGMYGNYSYYWRGQAPTNHVIFDGKCWRIVRINGDKSIRLIYNGTPTNNTCPGNGNSSAVIMGSSNAEKYYATSDGKYNNSSYVGWTYTLNSQRTTSGTASNAKTQTEKWYKEHISEAAKAKVDTAGKFCNDRNTKNNETWRATGSTQYYAGYARIYETYEPTLSCPSGDVYQLSVGAITADEVMFAGGKGENNTSYYLYTGANYWTMSPGRWDGTYAVVFFVDLNGYLGNASVRGTNIGLRPVINLKADTLFAVDGDGTASKPYVVS